MEGLAVPSAAFLPIVLAVVLGGVALIWVRRAYSLYSCGASPQLPGAALPPGSLGWPLLGESLLFLRDPKAYAHSHVKRYGSVFKSSLLLRRAIVGTTPEFAKFVLSNSKLFRISFTKHVAEILGPNAFMFKDGPAHLSIKNLVTRAVRAEALRPQVHMFETIILKSLASWERSGTLNGVDACRKLTWNTVNFVLYRDQYPTTTPEGLKIFEHFEAVTRAAMAAPVKLPITTYGKGMKAKAILSAHYKDLMKESNSQEAGKGVFLEALLAARDDPEGREVLKRMDDDTITDTIILINTAAFDTTSTLLVWIMKILVEYPDVFRRLQAEHQEILKSKDPSVQGPQLTWEDTRNMVYTHKFLQEALRYISIIPLLARQATEDVEFEGHLIPKGWSVWTFLKFIHSDSTNYPDLDFNPDRFNVAPKPYTYLPFGTGAHMCPGQEMVKLVGCIFTHHITTTYDYKGTSPDRGTQYAGLLPRPRGGYPIKFYRRK